MREPDQRVSMALSNLVPRQFRFDCRHCFTGMSEILRALRHPFVGREVWGFGIAWDGNRLFLGCGRARQGLRVPRRQPLL